MFLYDLEGILGFGMCKKWGKCLKRAKKVVFLGCFFGGMCFWVLLVLVEFLEKGDLGWCFFEERFGFLGKSTYLCRHILKWEDFCMFRMFLARFFRRVVLVLFLLAVSWYMVLGFIYLCGERLK